MESRLLLSSLAFQFRLDDPGGSFAAYPRLMADLDEAGGILGSVLNGSGTINVVVRPDLTTSLAGSGAALATTQVGASGPLTVVEPGTMAKAQTGTDPGSPTDDAVMNLSTSFLADSALRPRHRDEAALGRRRRGPTS